VSIFRRLWRESTTEVKGKPKATGIDTSNAELKASVLSSSVDESTEASSADQAELTHVQALMATLEAKATQGSSEDRPSDEQISLANEMHNVDNLGKASLTLAKAVDAMLEKDSNIEGGALSDAERADFKSLMGYLLKLSKDEAKSTEGCDVGLAALLVKYGEPDAPGDKSELGGESKSRRDMLGLLVGGGAIAAMLTPQKADAFFGVDGSIMVAAITNFANQLFKVMNSGISDMNGMFGDLGEGIGLLEENLNFSLTKSIEQGSNDTDKQITALGALGDRLSEQLVANAQVSAAVGSQPGSGVCGDETIGAASANLSNLVSAQTSVNNAESRESKVNANKSPSATQARNERRERLSRIRPQNGQGDWNPEPLSYSRTIAPGSTSKRETPQSQAGADYIKWSGESIPNSGDYYPSDVYFAAETDRMVTMLMQREARASVADHTLYAHYNEGIGDRATYSGMRSYFSESVRVQESGLQKAKQSQMKAKNGDGDAADNNVAVNTAGLELSKNILGLLDEYSTGSGNSRAISQRGLEDFMLHRWTGPEYKAFLRSSGPEPAPLLRDLISLQGDALKMDKERLDEQRLTNDLLQTMLRELIDSNTIRDREMSQAAINDRI